MVQGITPGQLDYENRLSWPKIILTSNTDQSLIRELSKVYRPSQKKSLTHPTLFGPSPLRSLIFDSYPFYVLKNVSMPLEVATFHIRY